MREEVYNTQEELDQIIADNEGKRIEVKNHIYEEPLPSDETIMVKKKGKIVVINDPVVEPPTVEERLAALEDRVTALEAL